MVDTTEIRALEERACNAWPARQTVLFGGWIFRLTAGLNKRASSVSALDPCVPFADVLTAAEDLYARHDLHAVFRLSPLAPPDADAALADAGYVRSDPVLVMIASLPPAADVDPAVEIEEAPSHDWFDGVAAAHGIEPARRPFQQPMLPMITMPAAFATVSEEGRAIGFGLAVYERGAVGLFDIVVAASARGRGHGTRLTRALLHWGRRTGAQSAYLQVLENNEAARKLYAALGFREAYRYHYRAQAAAP